MAAGDGVIPCIPPSLGTTGVDRAFLEPVRGAGGSGERIDSCSLQSSEDPGGKSGWRHGLQGNSGNHSCLGPGMAWPRLQPCPESETGPEHKPRVRPGSRNGAAGRHQSRGRGWESRAGSSRKGRLLWIWGAMGSSLCGVSSLPWECCQNTSGQ